MTMSKSDIIRRKISKALGGYLKDRSPITREAIRKQVEEYLLSVKAVGATVFHVGEIEDDGTIHVIAKLPASVKQLTSSFVIPADDDAEFADNLREWMKQGELE